LALALALFPLCPLARSAEKTEIPDGPIFYKSESYSVYGNKVVDPIYGGQDAPAIIYSKKLIYSPVRITPMGKTAVINASAWWRPAPQVENFPRLVTKFDSVDAVYNLALDILYRCSSGEYMRNEGEEGMWQAGYRLGEGYGVWTRDASYVGLWMGSFIDPVVAKRSIEYVTAKGIDNGEDGLAAPVAAVWNHYLVTGDSSIIRNTYGRLEAKVDRIQFDEKRGLGFARSGSFVDSGAQPEAGGFPLSVNILYAEAYRAMAKMAALMGDRREKTELWKTRGDAMRETIRSDYWKPACGFYTFGPKGSVSYEQQHWENLGQSLALWPQWGYSDAGRIESVLNHKGVAYTQYGFSDLNYTSREGDEGLHGQERWIFTEVGEAAAMARDGRMDELLELLATVIRPAAMHKTFYEVINWKTGKAWRYPGQLWHAMGYVSMIYFGVLGLEYDENGIGFPNACVPEPLADLQVTNFKYRNANLKIFARGWGVYDSLRLDGQPTTRIPADLKGDHTVEIMLRLPDKHTETPGQTPSTPHH
jgi:hypothetical protein